MSVAMRTVGSQPGGKAIFSGKAGMYSKLLASNATRAGHRGSGSPMAERGSSSPGIPL